MSDLYLHIAYYIVWLVALSLIFTLVDLIFYYGVRKHYAYHIGNRLIHLVSNSYSNLKSRSTYLYKNRKVILPKTSHYLTSFAKNLKEDAVFQYGELRSNARKFRHSFLPTLTVGEKKVVRYYNFLSLILIYNYKLVRLQQNKFLNKAYLKKYTTTIKSHAIPTINICKSSLLRASKQVQFKIANDSMVLLSGTSRFISTKIKQASPYFQRATILIYPIITAIKKYF